MDSVELTEKIAAYGKHLRDTADAFNAWAENKELPVRMHPDSAVEAVKKGVGIARIASFWSRLDDTGIVHESQLKTAIECFVHLRDPAKRFGHVVGAMQSGKTTTSLALQWAGPILYLLTGERAYPFYIIGSQTSHADQTTTELERFLAYYGNVELRLADGADGKRPTLDAMFDLSPSLATYRERVLVGMLQDVLDVPQLEDMVQRRVGGEQALQKIVDLCGRASNQGYRPLMIIDEPQFGASDRMVLGDDGMTHRKCVLAQILDRIEEKLHSTRNDHWFVGLSATPFELNDLERVWEVRQYLTERYSGFNYFNQSPISPDVTIEPPTTMSLSTFAAKINVPFLAKLSMAAYDGSPKAFARHARKIGYEGDQAAYRAAAEAALRDAINAQLDEHCEDRQFGLCIRAFNDNAKTQALISRLGLDPDRLDIIEYFGPESAGISVKRAIARRKRPELPYLVLVTNRARMADAFPTDVKFFMDLAQKAADLNALLQGLLGRACGYNKKSTVVLSDANADIVDAYVATQGGYVHKTSRHSITVGGFRRGAPTGMLKLRVDLDDEQVRAFFRRIDEQIVLPYINPGASLSTKRSKGAASFRTGPILLIAEELGLFDHIEQPAVRTKLFPQIRTAFRVARRDEQIRHSHDPLAMIGYSIDASGNCRYTFRWSDRDSAAQGGAAGRAMGQKDVGQHMEPTVYVEKYDPSTGEVIDDRAVPAGQRKPGSWRAFMVTFPLRDRVREVRPADVAFPKSTSPYSDLMEPDEKAARDREEARLKNPRGEGGVAA